MKKFFIGLILLFASLLSFKSFAFEENKQTIYTTSSGDSFYLNDIVIYYSDLNHEFNTSQEFIDYIYITGYNRVCEISEKYDIFGHNLTAAELELCIAHPIYALKTKELSDKALSVTKEKFPNACGDGELGNAFQHAYWTTLLYYNTEPEFAIKFVEAHEDYDSNPELHKYMDLYNNKKAYDNCNIYDFMSDDDMLNSCLELVCKGKLIYIIFNYEYVSRSVYYVATNTTVETKAYADLYAYTNSNIPYNVPQTVYSTVSKVPGGATVRP